MSSSVRAFAASVASRAGTALLASSEDVQELSVQSLYHFLFYEMGNGMARIQ